MLAKLEAAVGVTPWDGEVRLVYADCLEEDGQDEEAERQRRAAAKKPRRPARVPGPEGRVTPGMTGCNAIDKRLRARRQGRCQYCPLHKGCNGGRGAARSSWKKTRKRQWRAK